MSNCFCGGLCNSLLSERVLSTHYGGPTLEFVNTRYSACERCGSIRADTQEVNSLSSDYYSSYSPHALSAPVSTGEFFRMRAEELIDLLRYYGKKVIRVLEYGCGSGEFAEIFLYLCQEKQITVQEYAAVEPNSRSAAISRDKGLIIKDNSDLRSERQHYDVLVCMGLLEHIQDPLVFIEKMSATMAPKSLLYVDVPDCESIVQYRNTWGTNVVTPHLHHFSAFGLLDLLRNARLSPLRYTRNIVVFQHGDEECCYSSQALFAIKADPVKHAIESFMESRRKERLDITQIRDAILTLDLEKKVVIWGVGGDFATAFKDHPLPRNVILCDVNPNKIGKKFLNVVIASPEFVKDVDAVFSFVMDPRIADDIEAAVSDLWPGVPFLSPQKL